MPPFKPLEVADFNSDDIVEAEPADHPYANAGQKSIEKLLAHAVEDRLASKRRVKSEIFLSGAPSTQYLHALWYNRFRAYLPTINVKDGATPTAEHIQRFLFTIATRTKSSYSSTRVVPSYVWVQNGLLRLIEALVWHHKDFTLSAHGRSRIRNTIEGLVRDGITTKSPAKQRQWVGFVLIKQLSYSWFLDALENGCISWDVTISRLLSVVLLSAFDSRAGEVVRSPRYEKLEYLQWKHIEIKALDEEGSDDNDPLSSLEARFHLVYEKGKKDNPEDNKIVALRSLDDRSLNVLCPLKLLFIHALRSRLVVGSTMDAVVSHARSRPCKLVEWTHPEWPVIPALSPRYRAKLDFTKAARVLQINQSLKMMGDAAGLLTRVTSHAVRYGGARDVAHLPADKIPEAVTSRVAAVLRHSFSTQANGITAQYIGPISTDVYALKAQHQFSEPFGLQVAEKPREKRKRKDHEIDIYCETEGLDPEKKTDRQKAARRLEANDFDAWAANAKEGAPLSARTPSQVNQRGNSGVTESKSKTLVQKPGEPDIPIDPVDDIEGVEQVSSPEPAIDDKQVSNLGLCLSNNSPEENTDLVDHAALATSTESAASINVLKAPAGEFIAYFASINVFRNQGLATEQPGSAKVLKFMPTGNTRNEPTHFRIKCKNHIHGCAYDNPHQFQVDIHEVSCGIKEGVTPTVLLKKFECDRCSTAFTTKSKLKEHIERVHDWVDKPCDRGCTDGVLFKSLSEYKIHVEEHHTGWTATRCPVKPCQSDTAFTTRKRLDQHLTKTHRMDLKSRASIFAQLAEGRQTDEDEEA